MMSAVTVGEWVGGEERVGCDECGLIDVVALLSGLSSTCVVADCSVSVYVCAA